MPRLNLSTLIAPRSRFVEVVNPPKRVRFGGWYLQVKEMVRQPGGWLAWASLEPTNDVLLVESDSVYFHFGTSEDDALEKLRQELNQL